MRIAGRIGEIEEDEENKTVIVVITSEQSIFTV